MPLPKLFRPHAGAIKFGGHFARGYDIFLFRPVRGEVRLRLRRSEI